ncbi:hypothetical protein [Nocardioides dongkuii]|uniref:hypothetical protein n=1 Tax=Nocardioides dongkuii TaxID=2760089 RepID=UPI0015FAFA6A|nr:hypothetical protein [Nocardioides dongkuii]
MRVRRLLAAVISTALVAPMASLVATSASPASAATATRIVSAYAERPFIYSVSSPLEFGDSLSAGINVVDPAGNQVFDGSLTLQRQLAGQSSWTTVATSSTAYMYESVKAAGNATYRVLYSGDATYAASSAAIAVKVQRKIEIGGLTGRKAGFKGKVKPKDKTKITVLKKQGKKYKKFKALKSNKKGRFSMVLPAPRNGRFHWKIVFKGSRKFASSTIKGSTYRL